MPNAPWHEREYSEETAREVDCAVRALDVLQKNRELLERGAKLLLETLAEAELVQFRPAL